MANNTNGTYGTKRPAMITSSDCDIFYYYRPSRSESGSAKYFKKLDSSYLEQFQVEYDASVFSEEYSNDSDSNLVTDGSTISEATTETLPGLYNLKLPLSVFGQTGIYTIYIKPKEKRISIYDIGYLSSYPDIKGIVLNTSSQSNTDMYEDGNLIGYRVEYFTDGERDDMFRIITSNYHCEPVSQGDTESSINYRYCDNSSLVFCTVTPSTSLSYKSGSAPDIGTKGQTIALINTKFNPVSIEVEMVEHDIETVTTMLEGTQIRNLDSGTITTFDSDGNIYHQASYGNVVNSDTDEGLNHDFKIPLGTTFDSTEKEKLETIQNNIR